LAFAFCSRLLDQHDGNSRSIPLQPTDEIEVEALPAPNGAKGRGLGAVWHDTRRLPARSVHNAARHRRRQPRQIYIGELSGRYWSSFSEGPVPEQRRVIHRLRKISA
jgi:hypothetical protein